MKKAYLSVISILLIFSMAGVGFAQEAKITQLSDLSGKVLAGIITVVPKEVQIQMFFEQNGVELKDMLHFSSSSDAVAGLLAGKVDGCGFSKMTADYYAARNPLLASFEERGPEIDIVMAMRADDEPLRDDINAAIATLTENGVLEKLQNDLIVNLPVGNEPVSYDIPKVEGARTVYVGVSGDIVPLDYIAVDGKPAGYSIQLLAEVSKLINVNFEFVSIATEAKFTALSAGKIDLIFAHLYNNSVNVLEAMNNNSWIASKPYFTSNLGMLVMK